MTGWIFCLALVFPTEAPSLLSPTSPEEPARPIAIDERAASEWITGVVRDLLPHEYEDVRDWGKTKRVWDGLHLHRDGLEIKTKRRWKDANHGTWKMYRVQLVDPQEQFRITVANIRSLDNGAVAFDLSAEARLALSGRIAEWQRDVQLFSVSAQGVARIRLATQCELAMRLDPRKLPPDLVLVPKVAQAELRIDEFRLDRISKLDGPLVEEVGRGMRQALEEKLRDDESLLAEKLNRQIAKNQDKLRLSLHDAINSKWSKWLDPAALAASPPASQP